MTVHELIDALQAFHPEAVVGGEWFSPKRNEVVHGNPLRVVANEDDPALVTIQGLVEARFPMQDFDHKSAQELMPYRGGATQTE